MNARRLAPFFVALLLVGCEIPAGLSPLFAPPSAPTLDDVSLNAIVAGTAAAAASQTAAAPIDTVVPTVTSLPTATLLITTTPSPVPSLTPTFIFLLPTATKPKPTATVTETKPSSGGSAAGGGGEYACQLLLQEPENDTKISSGADFDGKWRVRNTGDRKWDENSADYRYLSGDKFHVQGIYDFWKTVAPGEQITLAVDMKAPKKVGTYTTRWEIRIGQNHFCRVELTIQVK